MKGLRVKDFKILENDIYANFESSNAVLKNK